MKYHKILSLIVAILLSSNMLYAQEFYTYKLFDNKFQVVFPGEPSIQHIPNELLDPKQIENSLPYEYKKQLSQQQIKQIVSDTITTIINNQLYIYSDTNNQVAYIAQSVPSKIEDKNYKWSGIQNKIDKLLKDALIADNRVVISFSSTYDKNDYLYTALYTTTYMLEGQKIYSNTKHIYYKDKVYKWTVQYANKISKNIFDTYQQNVKLIYN